MTQGMGLVHFIEQLFPAQGKGLVGGKLRDQVVVVGVEPLGQFLGVLRLAMVGTAATGRGATGHGEQGVEGRPALGIQGAVETLWNGAQGQGVTEHLVVPGKVADGQQVDAGVFLQLPVPGPQFTTHGLQCSRGQVALPVGFEGFFQFAVGADAGKTEGVGQCHGVRPPVKDGAIVDSSAHMRQTQPFRVDHKFYSWSNSGA